jgi:hypothetical protein
MGNKLYRSPMGGMTSQTYDESKMSGYYGLSPGMSQTMYGLPMGG